MTDVVRFKGGLGNQMFQYAIYKIFEKQHKPVYADLSYYANVMQRPSVEEQVFTLSDVFPRIRVRRAAPSSKRYFMEHKYLKDAAGLRCVYKEPLLERTFDDRWILKLEKGYLDGFFQTFHYPGMVEDILREEFSFCETDKRLGELIAKLENGNFVSVHIRRAAYLLPYAMKLYGDGCNDDYYLRAMRYVEEMVENPVFCFFSDDIPWVKSHYQMENAVFIGRECSDVHGDWYDMCLMSHCKHNIIANSTFSWWGAWLNKNPNKIVVAPKKWYRADQALDICPPEWVRM